MGNIGPILRAMGMNKLRFGLIALEIALTLAIVVNCVALIGEASGKLAKKSGMDDDDLIVVTVTAYDPRYKAETYIGEVMNRDIDRIRLVPGVADVTQSHLVPWINGGNAQQMRALGETDAAAFFGTQAYNADDRTLSTLGLTLAEGRTFTLEETLRDTQRLLKLFSGPRERKPDGLAKEPFLQEIVVSPAFAARAFGHEDAIGKMLEDKDGDEYRVIGVTSPLYNPFGNGMAEDVIFFANRAGSFGGGMRYLVRAEPGRRDEVMRAIDASVLGSDDGREVRVRAVADLKRRFHAQDMMLVGVLALVLCLVVFVTFLGVVGITSFSVAERTRQIGIRRALGARKSDVVAHFLIENALVSTIGVVVGAGFAYALNVILVTKFGGARVESAAVIGGSVLLLSAGFGATYAPARRAAEVAPTTATKNV